MNRLELDVRKMSIAGFSFLFAYILSFLFEGQVLYGLIHLHEVNATGFILIGVLSTFAGLFTCGLFVRTQRAAKLFLLIAFGVCLAATVPFFFPPSALWSISLAVDGFIGGFAVAAWGFCLKAFTPRNERLKSCADVLIYSNLLMIVVNVVAINQSPHVGLALSMICLVIGMIFIWKLPAESTDTTSNTQKSNAGTSTTNPLLLLCIFVFVITINSGLMYQVINPSFEHLTSLVSWYWAVPYIASLAVIRSRPKKIKGSRILYMGMAMIVGAFIAFMLLGRGNIDYIIIDTLMLGACGIFDLFWWSILGEMLDYTDNPAAVFGIGLSANVLGVLAGDILGVTITSIGISSAEIAVIALTIVCITLVMLPILNRQLVFLLKAHTYLVVYDNMSRTEKKNVINQTKTLNPLTSREQDVLSLILAGKSNRGIAETLFISESTVKTHVRNIFSKYDVSSRAELISTILKNQTIE